MYDGIEHVSLASLPGLYDRTIPIYTFSKTYAVTGLRLGYLATNHSALQERILELAPIRTRGEE